MHKDYQYFNSEKNSVQEVVQPEIPKGEQTNTLFKILFRVITVVVFSALVAYGTCIGFISVVGM